MEEAEEGRIADRVEAGKRVKLPVVGGAEEALS